MSLCFNQLSSGTYILLFDVNTKYYIYSFPLSQLLSDDSNFSSYQLRSIDIECYLRLDNSASKALNIDQIPGEPQHSNLIGLLNKCHTPQGQRLITQWIKQPLIDKNCIGKPLSLK